MDKNHGNWIGKREKEGDKGKQREQREKREQGSTMRYRLKKCIASISEVQRGNIQNRLAKMLYEIIEKNWLKLLNYIISKTKEQPGMPWK